MNEKLIEIRGASPLILLLDQEFGGWPVITANWTMTNDSLKWSELVAKLRTMNNNIMVEEWVGADAMNSSLNMLHVSLSPKVMSSERGNLLNWRTDGPASAGTPDERLLLDEKLRSHARRILGLHDSDCKVTGKRILLFNILFDGPTCRGREEDREGDEGCLGFRDLISKYNYFGREKENFKQLDDDENNDWGIE